MSFDDKIKNFVVRTKGATEKQVRYICLDLLTNVVKGTPVDTGRARGNWQTSINAPVRAEIQRLDKHGAMTIANESKTVNQAPGQVFYITNNLPYIARLEFEGWSGQAPQGWVRKAVARTKAIANKIQNN